MMKIKHYILIFTLLLFFYTNVFATDFYISTTGDNGNTGVDCDNGFATFSYANSQISSGDTIYFCDGDYTDSVNGPVSGPGTGTGDERFTHVKAVNNFEVTISNAGTTPLYMDAEDWVKVEGIIFKEISTDGNGYSSGNIPTGSTRIYLKNCGFYTTDHYVRNNVSNLIFNGTYCLAEDIFAWGGGRYKIIMGDGSENNILRRVVVRHDKEKQLPDSDPAAGVAVYLSKDAVLQNFIVIDSDGAGAPSEDDFYREWRGAYWLEQGNQNTTTLIQGCMAVNISRCAMQDHDTNETNAGSVYLSNFLGLDVDNGYIAESGHASTGDVKSLDHVTMWDLDGTYGWSPIYAWGAYGYGSYWTLTNSVLYNNTTGSAGGGVNGFTGSNDYNSFYDNYADYGGSSTVGGNDITASNPSTSAILYPVRIETSSYLSGAASDSGDIGATILYKYGTDGTFYGDSGYNTLTAGELWPWDNEDVIKTSFQTLTNMQSPVPDATRGFTTGLSIDGSSQSLTKYIWEYLGNQIPSDIYGDVSSSEIGPGTSSTFSSGDSTVIN